MTPQNPLLSKLLETIVDHLDIPKSLYERAVARHKSLGDWFCRKESKISAYSPHVSPQGSFQYGTVNRPLLATEEYDLDNVTTLNVDKSRITQKQLKELFGDEVKAYAKANGMLAPVEEKDRCWRLVYADEANFHLDTLPCVPENRSVISAIAMRGVPEHLARLAVSIPDRRHPSYEQISQVWLSSNPRGFAAWFEQCTRTFAFARIQELIAARAYASVDDVPPYEWKTPLQRSIQFMKRHRDVMFRDQPSLAPISMIITNLAARAYSGEPDLTSALAGIVERMPQYVNPMIPRVPNPADRAEDYADKWAKNSLLESNFWMWHTQLKLDISRLPAILAGNNLAAEVRRILSIDLSNQELAQFVRHANPPVPLMANAIAPLKISAPPRPWGKGD